MAVKQRRSVTIKATPTTNIINGAIVNKDKIRTIELFASDVVMVYVHHLQKPRKIHASRVNKELHWLLHEGQRLEILEVTINENP